VQNRSLTDEEKLACRVLLRCSTLLLNQLNRDLERSHGISLAEFEVLVALAGGPPEGVRMTTLAEISLLSKSRLSHCVDRLQKRGCVSRETAPNDRRGLLAMLTDLGSLLVDEILPTHSSSMQRHVIDLVSYEELVHVSTVVRRIADSVEALRR
jgi:DNA-binding MarR family transcriptional regulator